MRPCKGQTRWWFDPYRVSARLVHSIFHPERMQVNSRGRAALRDAHGMLCKRIRPCVRVKPGGSFDPYRVSARLVRASVGFAQSRSPTAIKVRPFRTWSWFFQDSMFLSGLNVSFRTQSSFRMYGWSFQVGRSFHDATSSSRKQQFVD